MSQPDDLWKAMKMALSTSGDLNHLRMKLEENILESLQQPIIPRFMSESMNSIPTRTLKPAMPPEIILANSLIKQYLRHAGLNRTADILLFESSLPEKHSSASMLQTRFPSYPLSKPFLSSLTEEYIMQHVRKQEGAVSTRINSGEDNPIVN